MSTLIATKAATARGTTTPSTSLVGRLSQILAIRRERRALMALDDRMLADVGLSRADVYREAHGPLWRPLSSRDLTR